MPDRPVVLARLDGSSGRDADALAGRSLVVVLSFEGREDTLRCVASLVDGSPAHTVLVVDNGSGDGTVAAVEERFPQVRTHETGANLGFAGGMNVGVARGLAEGFDAITILNNDTVVEPGAMDRLVAAAMRDAVAVSPRVVYLADPTRDWFAGGVLDPHDGLPRHAPYDEARYRAETADAAGGCYPVDLLAGCCIAASSSAWRRVGGFDERYFLNFEDSDWSLRARAAGFSLQVDPRAVVRHRVSASFVGQHSYLGTFYYTRNLLLFARTWRGHGPRGWAMLWRRVVRPLPSQLRGTGIRESARRTAVVASGVVAHLTRRYGRAPRALERRATSWAGRR
ncbi:hypothetical protein GCM10025864_26560 [Luteimicrobium album]|uniref:Glycosyltransferase 2-like domain-containing protein n=1 Tax=Luteimicrobium album TaxID=1054550 RepID=A0ABQ6I2Q4_9MICO|nr:glycosyltransferase family 2 protein [Luteimicrobium album]GMA24897.1 hypothetical protein GCM10025864_26560 [Luteimicrobium album]